MYEPGSADSAVRVFSSSDFAALPSADVSDIFAKKCVLVRGGDVDDFWAWGLKAFSAIRPVFGTTVNVQRESRFSVDFYILKFPSDSQDSFSSATFVGTVTKTIPELVDAGSSSGKEVLNCLDLPLGFDRLRAIPHASGHG